jgi:hypothetical protein
LKAGGALVDSYFTSGITTHFISEALSELELQLALQRNDVPFVKVEFPLEGTFRSET